VILPSPANVRMVIVVVNVRGFHAAHVKAFHQTLLARCTLVEASVWVAREYPLPNGLRGILDLTWNSRDCPSLALNVVRAIPQPSRLSLHRPENRSSRFSRRPRCRMWIEPRNWPLKRSPVTRRPAAKCALLFLGILPIVSRRIGMHWSKERTLKPRCRSRD
jgi:hypothetical protein